MCFLSDSNELEVKFVLSRLLQDVDIDSQSYTMSGLKKNTEYSFRVVANNKHGPGVSTDDVVVRTLSDGQSVQTWHLTVALL